MTTRPVFTVIVRDGYVVNRNLGILGPNVAYDCDHEHRTEDAAMKCLTKLQIGNCERCGGNRGSWACRDHRLTVSARWYNAYVFSHLPGSWRNLEPDPADSLYYEHELMASRQ